MIDAVLSVAFEAKRLVELAIVAKKFVVVAFVPVALVKVKDWRVLDPVTRRLVREPRVMMLVDPAQVDSAVFSTLFRARLLLRLAVVVPARVPVPDAYTRSPRV